MTSHMRPILRISFINIPDIPSYQMRLTSGPELLNILKSNLQHFAVTKQHFSLQVLSMSGDSYRGQFKLSNSSLTTLAYLKLFSRTVQRNNLVLLLNGLASYIMWAFCQGHETKQATGTHFQLGIYKPQKSVWQYLAAWVAWKHRSGSEAFTPLMISCRVRLTCTDTH